MRCDMKFSSELEAIETLRCCPGVDYVMAKLLVKMVREKWSVAETEFKKFGVEDLYKSIYSFYHGDNNE